MRDRLKTSRTTLRRKPERGTHDFETIAAILDEGLFCHAGFVVDGQPFVVPTAFGRRERTLYIHGSAASRMLRSLARELPVCVTVTLFDGLVFALSAFHHSVNYRSVMVLGTAREALGDEKLAGLEAITEHMARGRWDDARKPTPQEMKATSVLMLPIDEASAKVREGPPLDDDEDLTLPVWAGVLPFSIAPGNPVPADGLASGVALPAYVRRYRR